jgi:sulfate transport system ATP-binding protein
VTHDQEEAFEVADEVVVMNHGRIEQVGSPSEVFEHPKNACVRDFLGNVNVFHGRVKAGRATVGSLALDYPDYPHAEERPAALYMRPHELEIVRHSNGTPGLAANIERVQAAGAVARIALRAVESGSGIQVELSAARYAELQLRAGESVFVSPKRVRVFMEPEYVI